VVYIDQVVGILTVAETSEAKEAKEVWRSGGLGPGGLGAWGPELITQGD